MDITRARAIVTGGASGLGRATAQALRGAGAQVTLLDRDPAGAALAEAMGAGFAQVDVTDAASVATAVDGAAAAMGGLTLAVNCAGIASGESTLGRGGPHRPESFLATIQVNLVGTFLVGARAAAAMAASGADPAGVIVNTASIAATDGQRGQAAYAASKGGVAALSLPMARDLARAGIRVVALAPGIFRTPMLEGLGPEVMDGLAKDVVYPPRLGEPAEFARAVIFAYECDYLNGTTIRLDGALRMP